MADPKKPEEPTLVPDFAVVEENDEGATWTPLTESNPDYEKLWTADAWTPQMPGESPTQPDSEPTTDLPVADLTPTASPLDDPAETPVDDPVVEPPAVADDPLPETPGFKGTLVTGDEVLTASMVVSPEIIVLWGAGHEIGSWSHEQAKIARLTFTRFAIQAEGDTLTFTADDPTALDQAISNATAPLESVEATPEPETPAEPTPEITPPANGSKRPRIKGFQPSTTEDTPADLALASAAATGNEDIALAGEEFGTIADTVRVRNALGPRTVKARRFLMPQSLMIKVGVFLVVAVVLAGLVYLGLLVTGRVGGEASTDTTLENPPTTGIPVIITTAPPSTVATTLAPPMTTLFDTDLATLIERWNGLAETSEIPLQLPPDLVSPFFLLIASNVTMEGVIDPVAGNVTLTGTPTGTPEGDGPIITALGLLIATADPTLNGGDRRALLTQLGLDVNNPDLAGINGSLTYNGLAYRLVYDQGANSLSMIVTPEGAAAPTTTSN
ncbi:hypothetical protein BH18ACT5_BH18ACT5_14670 [soil metagenome]